MVYRTLHHEPFEPAAPHWQCAGEGPLSSANGALPWIMFARGRVTEWQITAVESLMPFRYLLSGGVSLRSLAPSWGYGLCRWVEERMGRWRNHFAMFCQDCPDPARSLRNCGQSPAPISVVTLFWTRSISALR